MVNRVLGVILIIVGVIALTYQGITYTTHQKVIDIGPIQATAEKRHTVPLPPVVGIVCLGGGVILLVTSTRRRAL